ncbi:MAG TPA: glycosyltransferase family 2 protein [Clostridia bacterium]|nr:glycosyltransferase family 2 protein [Clostridia bacterium]
MSTKRVSVLIPAYNEEDKIGDTVGAAFTIPFVHEVVVVDDASTDNTAGIAETAGAKVCALRKNLGKGGALNHGALVITGDIVLLLDGDLGKSAIEARLLLQPVLDGEADMTIASFPPPVIKGGFGLVKGLARKGIKFFSGYEMKSPLSGQRAMKRAVLEAMLPFSSGFGVEVGATLRAAMKGYSLLEVPVQMTHAETGRDLRGFVHRGSQFADVAVVLALCALERLRSR